MFILANISNSSWQTRKKSALLIIFLLHFLLGKGCLDSPLVSKCMPQLKQYIGIDPDKDSITELASRMKKFTGVQVSQIILLEFDNFISEC